MKRHLSVKAFAALLLSLTFTFNIAGQTRGWGSSRYGSLGFPTAVEFFTAPQTAPALPDVTGISGGENHTLFLRANGSVASAGANSEGVLGTGYDGSPATIPASVINLTDAVQVAAGGYHSMALRSDGTVWSWGSNGRGQLGIEVLYGVWYSNVPVQSHISDVVQISAGYLHSLALRADGTVWAWGEPSSGRTGSSTYISEWGTPRKIGAHPRFKNMIAVAAGKEFNLALKDDGTVWVWGNNYMGVYGDGTTSSDGWTQGTPRQVPGLTDVVQIAAGNNHVLALKRDGTVWAWGENYDAQAGAGNPIDFRNSPRRTSRTNFVVLTPTKVDISNVVEIRAGIFQSLIKKRDGSVWNWGRIEMLGIGMTSANSIYHAMPYPVQTLTGTGNVLIGTALRSSFTGKPSIQTPVGFGVRHYGENVQMLFSNVMTAGTTAYTALDPTSVTLNVPPGYAIEPNEPAYSFATTAETNGETEVCIKANEYDRVRFSLLKILHAEGADWVDRTFSSDYTRRRVCARVDSLGSFVLAKPAAGFGKD